MASNGAGTFRASNLYGVLVATKWVTNRPEFQTEMYMLLNLAVGSDVAGFLETPDGTTPAPADFNVYSVKVWQFAA